MMYLSHASFVSGIIISPFLVVGSVRQTSGLFFEHDLSFFVVDNHSQAPEFIDAQ